MSRSTPEVLIAMAKAVGAYKRVLGRLAEQIGKAWRAIPPDMQENLLLAARERRSIERYKARHERERQEGLKYVRRLGEQARRDLGLPLDDEGRR